MSVSLFSPGSRGELQTLPLSLTAPGGPCSSWGTARLSNPLLRGLSFLPMPTCATSTLSPHSAPHARLPLLFPPPSVLPPGPPWGDHGSLPWLTTPLSSGRLQQSHLFWEGDCATILLTYFSSQNLLIRSIITSRRSLLPLSPLKHGPSGKPARISISRGRAPDLRVCPGGSSLLP